MINLKISFEAKLSILKMFHLVQYDDFKNKIIEEEIGTIDKAN